MLSKMFEQLKKKWTLIGVGILFCVIVITVLGLGLRGLPGNPSATDLVAPLWSYDGPFELSPERGRFALLYSMVENHSFIFDIALARSVVPDLAINSMGQYVSLFAPGVSFLVVPGYIVGKYFGASQAGTFAVIALFALVNAILIALIARRLGARWYAALLGGTTYIFATPGFAYSTTLYQHQVSVFMLLLALWMLVRYKSFWSIGVIWFLCAMAVVVDNPNIFLMFPVGIVVLLRLWQGVTGIQSQRWKKIIFSLATFVALVPPVAFFLWYNVSAYGNPLQLPGTLQSVAEIDADGKPVMTSAYQQKVLTDEQLVSLNEGSTKEKTAVGFFQTRNLYNGFYIHLLSPDRGIVFFTPIMLLGIAGLSFLYRRNRETAALMIASIGVNILLYSLWGDPWGGWAFGSRYLIPTYALSAIGLACALSAWGKRWWFLLIFIPLFTYSAGVNSLGAITTNTNPPQVQVLGLEAQTGHEQKYTFLRNWEFLQQKYEKIGSKSFVYQVWAENHLTAPQYFFLVYGLVLSLGFFLLVVNFFSRETPPRL